MSPEKPGIFGTLAFFCLALLLPWSAFASTQIGIAPATRKILPETPLPDDTSVTIQAACGEWEAFQIIIRSTENLKGIGVSLPDLSGLENATLPSSKARAYREYYLDVTNESPGSVTYHERKTGLYPDPLIPLEDPYFSAPRSPGGSFDLEPGETGVVFVEWFVPFDTPPGTYTGTATLSADDLEAMEIPIEITVWEFEIPRTRTVATSFAFSDNKVRDFHGGPDGEESDEYDAIVNRYYEALHEHRIDPTWLKGKVKFEFDEDGELLPIDWTRYDDFVGPFVNGSRFADGVGVTRFGVAYFSAGRDRDELTQDQYVKASKVFAEHLESKGWWDKAYSYALDEPHLNGGEEAYAKIKTDAELLFQGSDLWRDKILMTGAFHESVADVVSIWCPVTPMYEDWYWHDGSMAGREIYAERFEKSEKLWFYVCNNNFPPYAGYDIDTAIGYEPRIAKWSSWYERASGFLFWRVNYWIDDDPWNIYLDVPNFTEIFARNGDGLLLYPGDHDGKESPKGSPEWLTLDGPVVSYRLKQIRDGLEDWELFILASQAGGENYVREQVARAYTRFGDFTLEDCENEGNYCPDRQPWTLDENLLAEVRENVAKKLLFLMYPDRYSDPEAEISADGDDDTEELSDSPNETKSSGGGGCRHTGTTVPAWFGVFCLDAMLRRRFCARTLGY